MRFRGFFALSGAGLLLGLVVLAWYYYGFAQPASTPPDEPAIIKPRETATNPGNKIVTPTPSIGSAPITYEITEAEATAQAKEYMAGLPLDLEGVRIRFQDGQVRATANVKIGGFSVPVAAQAVLDIEAGKPAVTVQKIDVGGLGAPEPVRQQIRDAIEMGLDRPLSTDVPLVFNDVTLANGVMTISGHQ